MLKTPRIWDFPNFEVHLTTNIEIKNDKYK
jgi:hypothetical protein